MNFSLEEAIEILERTPGTLDSLLIGLSKEWLTCNEGEGTWTATEVVAHLIEAEKTNWLARIETILESKNGGEFPPFDRSGHLKKTEERSIEDLLHDFKSLRKDNILKLRKLVDPTAQMDSTGFHPEFGEVKLRELISTWALHDLTHINQITRVMAERYRQDVGPWANYLGILNRS